MANRIQLKGGTAARAAEVNPLLRARELGVETDSGKFKIGDGVRRWRDLPYGGLVGADGPKGDKGEQGIQGPKGAQGDQGIQGPQGISDIKRRGSNGNGNFIEYHNGFKIMWNTFFIGGNGGKSYLANVNFPIPFEHVVSGSHDDNLASWCQIYVPVHGDAAPNQARSISIRPLDNGVSMRVISYFENSVPSNQVIKHRWFACGY